jgi:hypothetical protein
VKRHGGKFKWWTKMFLLQAIQEDLFVLAISVQEDKAIIYSLNMRKRKISKYLLLKFREIHCIYSLYKKKFEEYNFYACDWDSSSLLFLDYRKMGIF